MYLVINWIFYVEVLMLNFICELCVFGLCLFLLEVLIVMDIGLVEGMMVVFVLDEEQCILNLVIWN